MKRLENGLLVILEGGEGAGKTTQAKALVDYYNNNGYIAKYLREPGGDKLAEDIRNLILYNDMDATTETLMMAAARNINVQNNILPALKDGNIVILDRFTKSTLVYQGILGNGDMDFINACNDKVASVLKDYDVMEFTLLCDPEVAIKRAASDGHERNKFDVLPLEKYKKINDAYDSLCTDSLYRNYFMINTSNLMRYEVLRKMIQQIDYTIRMKVVYGGTNED